MLVTFLTEMHPKCRYHHRRTCVVLMFLAHRDLADVIIVSIYVNPTQVRVTQASCYQVAKYTLDP